ncbi:hypothetical protein BURPSS13_S0194 [Burkholderia pseudomallei S13]|nr:hypothetical protein BURPSS13_S0194 [Burkholderia pseudomallei S13]
MTRRRHAAASRHFAGTFARHARSGSAFTMSGCAADRRTSTIGQPT